MRDIDMDMFYDEEKTFQDFDDFIEKSEEFIESVISLSRS